MQTIKAIIAEAAGANPGKDRYLFESGGRRTELVLIPDAADAARVAIDLVAQGAEAIELCGGMGVLPQARVKAAVGDRARVGAILFGFESLTQVAAYKARFAAGDAVAGALMILQPGADPARDCIVREGRDRLTVLAVPDAAEAARAAARLAAEGVQLFELYGDFDAAAVAGVIDAVEAKVPVGLVGYGAREVSAPPSVARSGRW